ncbi:MAG: 2-phospho-L-lactate transferase CofD family protein [Eggerthellaceae bacterium]
MTLTAARATAAPSRAGRGLHSRTALERVSLRAAHEVVPYQPALEAIREADLIVLGPGSLFTSIIPNLLVPGVVDAIRASRVPRCSCARLPTCRGDLGSAARERGGAHGPRHARAAGYVLVHTPVSLRPDSPATGVFTAVTGADSEHASTADLDDLVLSGRIRPCAYATRTCRPSRRRGRWSLRATSSIPFIQPGTILLPRDAFAGC